MILGENVDDGRLDLGQSGPSTGLDWNHSTLRKLQNARCRCIERAVQSAKWTQCAERAPAERSVDLGAPQCLASISQARACPSVQCNGLHTAA